MCLEIKSPESREDALARGTVAFCMALTFPWLLQPALTTTTEPCDREKPPNLSELQPHYLQNRHDSVFS